MSSIQQKSVINKAKHAIALVEAQELWSDPNMFEYKSNVVTEEERFIAVGMIGDKLWASVFTHRETKTLLISCRRAREKEAKIYAS